MEIMAASLIITSWHFSPPHKRLSSLQYAVHAHKPFRNCCFYASVGKDAWAVSSSKHGQDGSLVNQSLTGLSAPAPDDDGSVEPILIDSHHPPTVVVAPGRRIVAIGDLHGDINQTRRALILAGLLSTDGQDRWLGGDSVLIQVGDILDRGDGEIAILSLLRWLKIQAELKGGAIFQVNGNHETMNVAGEFQYVDPGGFLEAERFVAYCDEEHAGDWEAALLHWRAAYQKQNPCQLPPSSSWMPWNFMRMQKAVAARRFLFSPGGPLACELSYHGVVLKVNDWLFAHGGILPHHVVYGLKRINKEVSQWMKGDQDHLMPFIAMKGFDSVVWSRLYSRETVESAERNQTCTVLRAMLNAAGAKGLVVGHTPQTLGANSECEGQIWRIDVGMSKGVLRAPPEVLEILGNKVKVLTATPHYFAIDDKCI